MFTITTHSSPVLKLQTSTVNSDYENVSSDEFDDINEEYPVNTKGEITIDLFTNSSNSSSDSEHENSKGGPATTHSSPVSKLVNDSSSDGKHVNSKGGLSHTPTYPVPLPPTTNIEI